MADHSSTTPKEVNDSRMSDDQAMAWSLGIARGDRAALGSLFDARFEWMLAQCRLMTGRDEHFALDTVQDAMLRLARGMLPLNTAQEVDRYLRAVLRSCAIDRLRSELRRAARQDAHTANLPHAPQRFTLAESEELQRLIASLTLQERDTLFSRIVRGVGLSTLAMLHHSTAPVMQGRLRRLLEHLRSEAKP